MGENFQQFFLFLAIGFASRRKARVTRAFLWLSVFLFYSSLPPAAFGGVPPLLNFQGRIVIGGVSYNGAGQFQFALVDGTGTNTFWSNDGTGAGGGEPTAAISLALTNGLYAVVLGDTNVGGMPQPIAPDTFTNGDVRLRVWFNDGTHGFEQLSPDQRIVAAGYSLVAQTANNFSGAVSSAQLPGNLATTNFVLSQGYATASVTNGLATTDYVNTATNGFVTADITNGLATTNFVLSQGYAMASVTNGLATLDYVNSLTNGFVTAAITNVLATTNFVAAQGYVTASVTNGLATMAYVNSSTNGFVTGAITNNLATTNFVLSQGYATTAVTNGLATVAYVNSSTNQFVTAAITNGLATTNYVNGITNGLASVIYVNAATNGFVTAAITNGLATTNFVAAQGYVTASVTNGLATVAYVNSSTNGFVTAAITNGLATTNFALALGLNGTNLILAASNSLSGQLSGKSGTNINYSQITNAPVIPSTNGFVTAAITNGLVTTNFALALGLNETNFTLSASNSLSGQLSGKSGTNINYSQITNAPVIPSTNGFVTAAITNGLATTNFVLTLGLNETNFTLATSNSLSGQLSGKSGTNINYSQITNAPVIPSTNGFVTAAITNGLATTNFVLTLGLNETNFTLAASNSLSSQLSGKAGTNINYSQITNAPVIPSTNGFVTSAITNGLATTNFVQSATNALRTAAYGTILNPITLNHRYTNGNFRAALTIEYFQANGANPAVNGGTGLYTNFNSGEGFNTFNPAANATNTQFATFFLSPNDIILVTNISTGTGVFSVTNSVVKTQL